MQVYDQRISEDEAAKRVSSLQNQWLLLQKHHLPQNECIAFPRKNNLLLNISMQRVSIWEKNTYNLPCQHTRGSTTNQSSIEHLTITCFFEETFFLLNKRVLLNFKRSHHTMQDQCFMKSWGHGSNWWLWSTDLRDRYLHSKSKFNAHLFTSHQYHNLQPPHVEMLIFLRIYSIFGYIFLSLGTTWWIDFLALMDLQSPISVLVEYPVKVEIPPHVISWLSRKANASCM